MATKIKYYKSGIANQPLQKGKITISFMVCEILGTAFMGVYKTEDAEEQKMLNKIVGTRGLSKSDEEEYDYYLKKKVIHDGRTTYRGKSILAQPQSTSVATVQAPEKKGDGEETKPPDGGESLPLPSQGTGNQDNKEDSLSDVEPVASGAAPEAAANYTQLAAKLSDSIGVTVTPDELKALKDRPDAPKRVQGKGMSVLEWKAFLTKVAAEQVDDDDDNEDGGDNPDNPDDPPQE